MVISSVWKEYGSPPSPSRAEDQGTIDGAEPHGDATIYRSLLEVKQVITESRAGSA
jgi:hypothetical protein